MTNHQLKIQVLVFQSDIGFNRKFCETNRL